jgi:hypothetical protein
VTWSRGRWSHSWCQTVLENNQGCGNVSQDARMVVKAKAVWYVAWPGGRAVSTQSVIVAHVAAAVQFATRNG